MYFPELNHEDQQNRDMNYMIRDHDHIPDLKDDINSIVHNQWSRSVGSILKRLKSCKSWKELKESISSIEYDMDHQHSDLSEKSKEQSKSLTNNILSCVDGRICRSLEKSNHDLIQIQGMASALVHSQDLHPSHARMAKHLLDAINQSVISQTNGKF